MAGLKRRVGLVLGVALALSLPLLLRVALDGRAELRAAEASRVAGEPEAEIRHLGRAARWRMPLATHDESARAQLVEIAREAGEGESEQQRALALAAWRELRASLLGARVVEVEDPELLREAEREIVLLMAADARAAGKPSAEGRWAAQLEGVPARTRGRTLLASAAFVGWVVSTLGFLLLGLDRKGKLRPRPALRWGGASLLLLATWILFM